MKTESIINNLLEKNLDELRNNINTILAEKAADKLEEMKLGIASNFFDLNKE
ncbi:MAG: hypothetical protein RL152_1047 [Bacteroidota bacterium]|jgi:hypothetical protein